MIDGRNIWKVDRSDAHTRSHAHEHLDVNLFGVFPVIFNVALFNRFCSINNCTEAVYSHQIFEMYLFRHVFFQLKHKTMVLFVIRLISRKKVPFTFKLDKDTDAVIFSESTKPPKSDQLYFCVFSTFNSNLDVLKLCIARISFSLSFSLSGTELTGGVTLSTVSNQSSKYLFYTNIKHTFHK